MTLPVKLPSMFAFKVPVVIVSDPVDAPVKEPVPTMNLSSDSSKPKNALSALPLSMTIPESLAGVPEVPLPSSIKVSATTVLVVDIVVVAPLTVRSPVTIKLSLTVVTEVECPIDIAVPLTPVPIAIFSAESDVAIAKYLSEPCFIVNTSDVLSPIATLIVEPSALIESNAISPTFVMLPSDTLNESTVVAPKFAVLEPLSILPNPLVIDPASNAPTAVI